MEFSLLDGRHFEIPDDWWREAGMHRFKSPAVAYTPRPLDSGPEMKICIVDMKRIRPVRRDIGVIKDFGGFERERLVRVLRWIVHAEAMEPIELCYRPDANFEFDVRHGFHRYHASVAAGFVGIPAVFVTPIDWFGAV